MCKCCVHEIRICMHASMQVRAGVCACITRVHAQTHMGMYACSHCTFTHTRIRTHHHNNKHKNEHAPAARRSGRLSAKAPAPVSVMALLQMSSSLMWTHSTIPTLSSTAPSSPRKAAESLSDLRCCQRHVCSHTIAAPCVYVHVHVYVYVYYTYMYVRMYICMHGWMDGWMDAVGR